MARISQTVSSAAPGATDRIWRVEGAGGVGDRYSDADFKQTIKTGRDPNKHELNPFMPWRSFANMSDDEFNALYAFLRSVPPVASAQK